MRKSFHHAGKYALIAFFLLASLVPHGLEVAHAQPAPAASLTTDQLLSAMEDDKNYLLGSLISGTSYTPPTVVRGGTNKAPFGTKVWPAGLVPFALGFLNEEGKQTWAGDYKTQDSPGDASGIKKGDAILAWARVCSYLPIYLEGDNVTYPDYNALVSKHKNDNDNGAAFTAELTTLLSRADVKLKGPVGDIFKLLRDYVGLLDKKKQGDGLHYLVYDDAPRGFMADLTQFALGFVASGNDQTPYDPEFLSPAPAKCVAQSGQTCLNDAQCDATQRHDWCNPISIHLGNPCMMVVSDIIYTEYSTSNPADWKINEIEPYAPFGAFTSKFQTLRGGLSATDFPCFFSGSRTSCTGGVVSYWFASPAGEKKIVDEMLATTDRIAQYRQWLQDQIAALNGTGNAGVAADVTKIGSSLSLPLPFSDTTIPAVISRVIKQLLSIVGALALAFFIWGGLRWMLARGAPEEVAKAKKIIVAAVSGLIAIFASYAILDLIINAVSK